MDKFKYILPIIILSTGLAVSASTNNLVDKKYIDKMVSQLIKKRLIIEVNQNNCDIKVQYYLYALI